MRPVLGGAVARRARIALGVGLLLAVILAMGSSLLADGPPPGDGSGLAQPLTAGERRQILDFLTAAGAVPARLDDHALEQALISHARRELGLRIRPRDIDRLWGLEPARRDPAAELQAARRDGALGAWISSISNADERYLALRAAASPYRDAETGDFTPLVSFTPLREGAEHADVAALRKRLISEDVDLAPAVAPTVFDKALTRALSVFQARNGLDPDGVLGPRTLAALNVTPGERLAQIDVNLERLRWLPRSLPPDRLEVNIATAEATLYRRKVPVLTMRVVVGDPRHRTPMFASHIDAVVFNPPWNVPVSIAEKEILPRAAKDPSYLARHHFRLVDGRLQQRPGPDNALGQIKFDLPSPYGVYLHDTPGKTAFARAVRTLSHGCMRLERPGELALALLEAQGWTAASVTSAIASGETQRVAVRQPLPLFVIYQTAVVEPSGKLRFAPDVYGWDARLASALAGLTPGASGPRRDGGLRGGRRDPLTPIKERDPGDGHADRMSKDSAAFARWASGYGVVVHSAQTRRRIRTLAARLTATGRVCGAEETFEILAAADRLTNAAMWVVAHMTYARRVDLSGAPLAPEDFKPAPQGHTGGALNVVPAYVGYLVANALTGVTRGWLLGQGHCAAAIEAVNALVGNLSPAQLGRYGADQAGLTRLVGDFYSYEIASDGAPRAPLGSHVTPHTAGALAEGGYLGFAELGYVHMPLPGESLVAILSDGAFEEQRGSDWAERWWRAQDCGLVAPVMILNGRRIEQRTEIAQDGGAAWLKGHLKANGFDPFIIDGADPAAFAWAVLEQERRLGAASDEIQAGTRSYPVRLPYAIARTVKGYGFPGAGTLQAHNLPLPGSPYSDPGSHRLFTEGAARLFVPEPQLRAAIAALNRHEKQGRPRERDNPLARRRPPEPRLPAIAEEGVGEPRSAMDAMDEWFVSLVEANPDHRVRVGNPDELNSNHMGRTLMRLKHRVNRPERGLAEAVDGAVITALNEEAVVCAALGNKGGLNLVVSYEAFAAKMLGALRQEILFARQQKEAGIEPGWLGVPLIATSHVWENGKNQQSHQDPTPGETLLGEMSDVSRVFFPPDAATAIACLREVYSERGVIGCIVAAKAEVPGQFTAVEAARAVEDGFRTVSRDDGARLQLVAIGAYQLIEVKQAAARLRARGLAVEVTAVIEPGRLRDPRDPIEAAITLAPERLAAAFPQGLPRLIACHTRPEPMLGILRSLDGGPRLTRAHGYANRGGSLDLFGMLFANRCTWAHLVQSAAGLLDLDASEVLAPAELAAVRGQGDPAALRQVKAGGRADL